MGNRSVRLVRGMVVASVFMALLSACGGNVVVDKPSGASSGAGATAGTGGTGGVTSSGAAGTGGIPQPATGSTGTGPASGWEAYTFQTVKADTPCNGSKFIKYTEKYGLYVGVSLCDSFKYKIWLGETKEGLFYEVADSAGGGQDHCELVNPSFTIPNEDDITSGGCKSCDIGPSDPPISNAGYSRAYFGDSFEYQEPWPSCCDYTPTWYSCGIAIP